MILCHLAALTAVVNICHDFSRVRMAMKKKNAGILGAVSLLSISVRKHNVSDTNENYFSISSKVSGRKGWETSQNSSWLVTGHLLWVVGTVFKSTSCIISSVNGSYGMLWMQLFLPSVKPEYCALAICGWGIDKISKHIEWLSLPQHLTLCSKFPSAAQWYLSEFIAVNGEWSWAPQSWAAEHLFFFSACGSVLISFF